MMTEETFFRQCVPSKFKTASLEECALIYPERASYGKKWAKNPCSIFIKGDLGVGKTYFAYALIRELFRVSPIVFWPRNFTSEELDGRLLTASKSDGGDAYEIQMRAEEDVLFIDDIGRETKSDRLKRQYFSILNRRYNEQNKITILTSNFSLDHLGDIIDPAISSRIQEWQNLSLKGPDLRKK